MRSERKKSRIIAINYLKNDLHDHVLYPMIINSISELYDLIIRRINGSFIEGNIRLVVMTLHLKLSYDEEEHLYNELLNLTYENLDNLNELDNILNFIINKLGFKPTKIKKFYGIQKK